MNKATTIFVALFVFGCGVVDPPEPAAYSSASYEGYTAVGMYEHVEYVDYQNMRIPPLALKALADTWEDEQLPRAKEVREFLTLMGFYVLSEATYNHERDHESAAFTNRGSVFSLLGKEHHGIYIRARYWHNQPPHQIARFVAHEAVHAVFFHFGWSPIVGGGHEEPFKDQGIQVWNEYWLPKEQRTWGPGLFEYEFQQKINEYLENEGLR